MSKIYRHAYAVWAWLGLADHQSRVPEAIEMFPRIVEAVVLRQTRNRELANQYVYEWNGTLDLE